MSIAPNDIYRVLNQGERIAKQLLSFRSEKCQMFCTDEDNADYLSTVNLIAHVVRSLPIEMSELV